jgi:hypothetical protein
LEGKINTQIEDKEIIEKMNKDIEKFIIDYG